MKRLYKTDHLTKWTPFKQTVPTHVTWSKRDTCPAAHLTKSTQPFLFHCTLLIISVFLKPHRRHWWSMISFKSSFIFQKHDLWLNYISIKCQWTGWVEKALQLFLQKWCLLMHEATTQSWLVKTDNSKSGIKYNISSIVFLSSITHGVQICKHQACAAVQQVKISSPGESHSILIRVSPQAHGQTELHRKPQNKGLSSHLTADWMSCSWVRQLKSVCWECQGGSCARPLSRECEKGACVLQCFMKCTRSQQQSKEAAVWDSAGV